MPKRSNEFQKLIYLVKSLVSEGALVTESKELPETISKRPREVDVVIESKVAGEPIVISIECVDKNRAADVPWVEAMHAKHQALPTGHLILASRKGFTRPAIDKAKELGTRILKFDRLKARDLAPVLKSGSWTAAIWNASPTTVRLFVLKPSGEKIIVRALPDIQVIAPALKTSTPLLEVVKSILSSNEVGNQVTREGTPDHTFFEVNVEYKQDTFYIHEATTDELHSILAIQIKGEFSYSASNIPIMHQQVGDDRVAWGSTKIRDHNAIAVGVQNLQGDVKMTVRFERAAKKGRNSTRRADT